MLRLLSIFVDVVTPVFVLVLLGYLLTPRLKLEARTLSRTAYYLFMPAFVFDIISRAEIQAALAAQMIAFAAASHIAVALLALLITRWLRKPRDLSAAMIMVAAYGNVGNFGLSIIGFRFGADALPLGTVYFLAITVISFSLCVAAASWTRGSGLGAILSVFKTPGVVAILPAVLANLGYLPVPLMAERSISLLSQAMIPTMLVTLGAQLASVEKLEINTDLAIAAALRLLAGPALAALIAIPFALPALPRDVGILQAAMPAAVLTSIVALEYDVRPTFVTTAVLVTTLSSLLTLTVVLSLL